jgi:hypothetical protein
MELEEFLMKDLSYDLDELSADFFAITGDGNSVVESLTGGHAMTELAASCPFHICSGSCSISAAGQ